MTTQPTVAMLGLGTMGLPMASVLSHHADVVGFDPKPERSRLATERGIRTCDSAVECVTSADVVVLAVLDEAQMHDALFGDDGVVPHLAAGTVVVITSTVGADAVRALDSRLEERGVLLVDAAVSGGPVRAEQGDLLVLVGAQPQAWDAGAPVVEAIGSTITRVGDRPGDGQALKTVNQLLCGIHIAATAEALALARGLGLDLRDSLDALSVGSGRSFMLTDRGERMLEWEQGRTPDILSTVAIFVKDLGLVGEAARTAHIATPVAGAAEHLFRVAERLGLENVDDSGVLHAIADLASLDIASGVDNGDGQQPR